MNRKISLLGLLSTLAFLAVLVLVPIRVNAAEPVFKVYNEGTVVKMKTNGKIYYKYTLEEDALVEFTYAYNNNYELRINIFDTKEMDYQLCYLYDGYSNTDGKAYLALEKGTYYINMYEGGASYSQPNQAKVKITSTPSESYNKENYCRSTAYKLEARKWVKLVETANNEYVAWYKITVPKKQKVTIDIAAGYDGYFALINIKNGKYYDFEYSGRAIVTENNLAAGTYYLAVHPRLSSSICSIDDYAYYYNHYAQSTKIGAFYQFRWY